MNCEGRKIKDFLYERKVCSLKATRVAGRELKGAYDEGCVM